MADKLDAHAMRCFMHAADERCAAMNRIIDSLTRREAQIHMPRYRERKEIADAYYETARNELLHAIERATD